jgi:hypothetical protein
MREQWAESEIAKLENAGDAAMLTQETLQVV